MDIQQDLDQRVLELKAFGQIIKILKSLKDRLSNIIIIHETKDGEVDYQYIGNSNTLLGLLEKTKQSLLNEDLMEGIGEIQHDE